MPVFVPDFLNLAVFEGRVRAFHQVTEVLEDGEARVNTVPATDGTGDYEGVATVLCDNGGHGGTLTVKVGGESRNLVLVVLLAIFVKLVPILVYEIIV